MASRIMLAAVILSIMFAFVPALSEEKAVEAEREDLEATIAHLLAFVRASDVVFIRNGREHTSGEAAEHIKRKYDHYRKKIRTPEDFIEHSATKSMMSGKLYTVRLKDGTVMPAKDWLTAELERHRAAISEAPVDTI